MLPAQLVADVPTHIGSFHPENFDRAYAGAVPAAQALARSLNVPAVRLLRAHGVDRFAAVLRRLGLSTLDQPGAYYGLALILGGAEGTLWDVTGVYAGLARSALARTPSEARGAFFEPSYRRDRTARARPVVPARIRRQLPDAPGDARGGAAGRRAVVARVRLGAQGGVEDRHELRLPRRVGDRRHAAPRGGRLGRQCLRRGPRGTHRPLRGGPDPVRPRGCPSRGRMVHTSRRRPRGHRRVRQERHARGAPVRDAPSRARAAGGARLAGLLVLPAGSRGRGARVPGARRLRADQPRSARSPGSCCRPALETYYRRLHADYRPPPPYRPDCRAALASGGERLALVRLPARGGVSSTSRSRWTARSGASCSRRRTATPRPACSGTSTTSTRARRGTGTSWRSPRVREPHRLVLVDERGETVDRRFTAVGRGRPRICYASRRACSSAG